MSIQITRVQPAEAPKIAFLTEISWERNRSKNRHLNPDFLGADDIEFVASDASDFDDEIYEEYEEDNSHAHFDALVRLLARRTIEEICIYCLVNIDEIPGEQIGNALRTSREMPRLRAQQIAEKISYDKEHDAGWFDADDETIKTIQHIIYASADEKLAYLYALSADKKKSTRGREKATLKAAKEAAQSSLFDAVGV